MRRKIVKVGDIFAIPLTNGKYIVGQVVYTDKSLLGIIVNIYDLLINELKDFKSLEGQKVIIKDYFSASGISLNKWPILERVPNFDYRKVLKKRYVFKGSSNGFISDGYENVRDLYTGDYIEIKDKKSYDTHFKNGIKNTIQLNIKYYEEVIEAKLKELGYM